MLKLTVYNYWRDANNYQQEKNKFRKISKVTDYAALLIMYFYFFEILQWIY